MTTESRRPPTAGPYRSRRRVTFGPREESMPGWRTRVPRWKRRSRATRRWGGYRSSQTSMTNLMIEAARLKRLIDATPSGMAYLSGTGPPGTVCEQCSFYGFHMQHPNSCYRYYLMVSEHGAAFPAETPSCKHFTPRNL